MDAIERQKMMEDLYDRHAVTPDEIRYLMAYRRLTPAMQRQVRGMAEVFLSQQPA